MTGGTTHLGGGRRRRLIHRACNTQQESSALRRLWGNSFPTNQQMQNQMECSLHDWMNNQTKPGPGGVTGRWWAPLQEAMSQIQMLTHPRATEGDRFTTGPGHHGWQQKMTLMSVSNQTLPHRQNSAPANLGTRTSQAAAVDFCYAIANLVRRRR
jgi:hypothetical protein